MDFCIRTVKVPSSYERRYSNMSFNYLRQLPSPGEIKTQFPLSERLTAIKKERDAQIRDIITGKDDRFLVIIGPCSADSEDPVCEYVNRLAKVQEKVKDRLLLIPRIYTNKPRTTGEGYKGIASQPDPEKAPDMIAGLISVRKMHLRAIEESELTPADEMLYPENWEYVSDLLSYVAIGARSVEDQQHRLTVSGFDVASGMKNPTSGDFSVMLNSVYAAQHAHHFTFRGYEVETTGNPLTHVVLRGAVSKHGNTVQNYHYEDIMRLIEMYDKMDLVNPAAIIDANHSNSGKKYEQQVRIVKEVMHNRQISPEIRKMVKGVMVESYLEPGCQKIGEHVYGKSITDPCLGWEASEQLIYDIAERN
ncbi:MAG: 3-deoxy-7-phosphoheptulonate synthase [Lachnospiraceae bacterium]|nr:3-deoxy-7-phosphoheptulonate synthase [bacterium]MDY5518080.1 3-deoxy-7-phosphoheptulonate synthase [Lachnospiraceae bacterium]